MGFLTKANDHTPQALMEISDQALTDLLVTEYMEELFDLQHAHETLHWKQFLTTDPEDLIYRREILEELRKQPQIVQLVRALCQCIQEIQIICNSQYSGQYYSDTIQEFKLFKHAHDALQALANALHAEMEQTHIQSRGLLRLYEVTREKLDQHYFTSFPEDWSRMTTGLDAMGSLTLRFTFDDELHITHCAVTAIQKDKYGKKLLPFGSRNGKLSDKLWDITPVKDMRTPAEELIHDELTLNHKQFLLLLRSLTEDLSDLYQDLTFYLAALNYWKRMNDLGQDPLFAEIRPMEEKAFTATGMVDPILLLHKGEAVSNDIDFAPSGEICILTGMNQGGKTTFLRTVGTLQVLFQLGWPLTAATASLSPVEKVVTVFSHEENTQLQHGKLGQELKTMQLGMSQMTTYSLMLFNEPITGTSPMENLYLSREILSACKLSGYHGIWVTHIYDLAGRADAMNAALSGSRISSLTVRVEGEGENVRTSYRIVRGAPSFTSYAKQVLQRETKLNLSES